MRADGQPAAYAMVAAVNMTPPLGIQCDEKGYYSIDIPVDSNIHIRIQQQGFTSVDTLVSLSVGQRKVLNVTLQPLSTLGKVTVSEERSRPTTFTNIDVERIEHAVGPQAGVEALLKTLPDVASNNELSTQYSVRGGSFDENLVYINNVEVYRPMLIRTGQQEGASIINPDMVDHILFSPGGFDAVYGDRMASVLDITYARPTHFRAKASASFLGASLFAEDAVGERFTYSVGFRHQANRYLLRSLDTKGNYTTRYTDLQALLTYRLSDHLNVNALLIASRNIYGLIPEEQTTTFGGFDQTMQFSVYYEGEEQDRYRTLLGALTLNWTPNDETDIKWITSFQTNSEQELYDILSQYRLDELNVGVVTPDGEQERFERGVGSYLEHARNYLYTNIVSTEVRGKHYALLGNWSWSLKLQHEQVNDRMREWKWVDSAGFAMPVQWTQYLLDTVPQTPLLQLYCRARHEVSTSRLSASLQRNFDFYNRREDLFSLVVGGRLQYYDINFSDDDDAFSNYSVEHIAAGNADHNHQLLFSPRVSFNYKPNWKRDMLFRLATGVYSQPPFYREYRYDDGALNHAVKAQNSYQVMGTVDWNFKIGESPFKFTTDVYYKYITNLIPYRVDNLRIRYDAHNEAVGYATGISLRLSGEVVEGLESWASLSLMKTQQDILGDAYGWMARPTDQRISLKIFFQDYLPDIPFWRMSLNFIVASGLPFTLPDQADYTIPHYYPTYYRIDWGNTIQLSRFERIKKSRLMNHVDDILVSFEVFNLFDYHNVVSFIWISDYANEHYAVPNYLTRRQLNLKLTVTF